MKLSTILTPLGIAVAVSAQAQSTPWTLRAGFSGLANNTAQNFTKFPGATVGIGYDLSHFRTGLSFDLNYDTHVNNGNKLESPSAMFVYRMPFSGVPDSSGAQNYFGFGLGVMQTKVTDNSSIFNGNATKTFGGGEFLLGVRMSPTASIELFARISPKVSGINPSTIGLVYAKHF